MTKNERDRGGAPDGKIRIGLIGASPDRGWAAMAHVPAIYAVTALTLQAVATRHERSARTAAEAFGAPLWFADAGALIAHDEVDAVVVAVKAPDHFALAKQALLAGKPVYCEMPFTRTLDEARELAALARERGIVTAFGVQGRFSPWIRQIKEVVASGRLGRILSTTMVGYDELSTGSVDQNNVYMLDVANGANPLTIHCGHNLDGIRFVLGELTGLAAYSAIGRPHVVVRQTGQTVTSTSPDQIALSGQLADGGLVSFHMRGGSGDPPILWEIQGTNAVLRVTSEGYLMWRPLRLELWDVRTRLWEVLPAPPPLSDEVEAASLDGPASFVAALYEAFAADILTGSARSVSFDEALALSETMEAVRIATQDNRTISPDDVRRSAMPIKIDPRSTDRS